MTDFVRTNHETMLRRPTVIGMRWEINRTLWLEALEALGWNESDDRPTASFCNHKLRSGDLVVRYSKDQARYFCEWDRA